MEVKRQEDNFTSTRRPIIVVLGRTKVKIPVVIDYVTVGRKIEILDTSIEPQYLTDLNSVEVESIIGAAAKKVMERSA